MLTNTFFLINEINNIMKLKCLSLDRLETLFIIRNNIDDVDNKDCEEIGYRFYQR